MKAVVQRVREASVSADGRVVGQTGVGLLVYVGVEQGDTDSDIALLARKTAQLRIFADEQGKMNRSVIDVKGSVLVISQFTLCADTRKGNRPSYNKAEEPGQAEKMVASFAERLETCYTVPVETGCFGAYMQVASVNDGPVTILLDSAQR